MPTPSDFNPSARSLAPTGFGVTHRDDPSRPPFPSRPSFHTAVVHEAVLQYDHGGGGGDGGGDAQRHCEQPKHLIMVRHLVDHGVLASDTPGHQFLHESSGVGCEGIGDGSGRLSSGKGEGDIGGGNGEGEGGGGDGHGGGDNGEGGGGEIGEGGGGDGGGGGGEGGGIGGSEGAVKGGGGGASGGGDTGGELLQTAASSSTR